MCILKEMRGVRGAGLVQKSKMKNTVGPYVSRGSSVDGSTSIEPLRCFMSDVNVVQDRHGLKACSRFGSGRSCPVKLPQSRHLIGAEDAGNIGYKTDCDDEEEEEVVEEEEAGEDELQESYSLPLPLPEVCGQGVPPRLWWTPAEPGLSSGEL